VGPAGIHFGHFFICNVIIIDAKQKKFKLGFINVNMP